MLQVLDGLLQMVLHVDICVLPVEPLPCAEQVCPPQRLQPSQPLVFCLLVCLLACLLVLLCGDALSAQTSERCALQGKLKLLHRPPEHLRVVLVADVKVLLGNVCVVLACVDGLLCL